MDVTLEAYGASADLAEADVRAITAIVNAVNQELVPAMRPMSTEAWLDDDSFSTPPEVVHKRLARDADGTVIGVANIEWRGGAPGGSFLHVSVAPDQRRRGVGRALAVELSELARSEGRDGVNVRPVEGSPLGPRLASAGFAEDMVVEQNWARPGEVPPELLEEWIAVGEAAAGYSLVAYDDRCPDDLVEAFVEERAVMNDAPQFAGQAHESLSVKEIRAAEAMCARNHTSWWGLAVRHDASGALVGHSDLYLHRHRPWIAFQGDTGVHTAHRGHRLGAWMKAANFARLRAERPEVEVVQTWNASHNAPMLAINRALGFQPVQRYRGWYRRFD